MYKNVKAASGSNRSDGFRNQSIKQFRGVQQSAFFDFRRNRNNFQCRKCGSDYWRYSTADGICIDCQQRAEFIVREHPETIANLRRRNAEVMR